MVPKLTALVDGADFVCGSRFASKDSYEVGLTHRSTWSQLR